MNVRARNNVQILGADGDDVPHGGESPTLTTVIAGTLRPTEGGIDVHLASGGHPPALLLSADGTAFEVTTIGGQAVGIVDHPNFAAAHILLAPGDTLLLYTDGLTEARTDTGSSRFDDDGALLAIGVGRRAAQA